MAENRASDEETRATLKYEIAYLTNLIKQYHQSCQNSSLPIQKQKIINKENVSTGRTLSCESLSSALANKSRTCTVVAKTKYKTDSSVAKKIVLLPNLESSVKDFLLPQYAKDTVSSKFVDKNFMPWKSVQGSVQMPIESNVQNKTNVPDVIVSKNFSKKSSVSPCTKERSIKTSTPSALLNNLSGTKAKSKSDVLSKYKIVHHLSKRETRVCNTLNRKLESPLITSSPSFNIKNKINNIKPKLKLQSKCDIVQSKKAKKLCSAIDSATTNHERQQPYLSSDLKQLNVSKSSEKSTLVSRYKFVKKAQILRNKKVTPVLKAFPWHTYLNKKYQFLQAAKYQVMNSFSERCKKHVSIRNGKWWLSKKDNSWCSKYSLKHRSRRGPSDCINVRSVVKNLGGSRYKLVRVKRRVSNERRCLNMRSKENSSRKQAFSAKYFWVSSAQKKARKNSNIKRRLSLSSGNGNNKQILARHVIRKSIFVMNRTHKSSCDKSLKKQYCIFFNRFGRCNRGSGCPFIHDSDKVAVCTRFLRGTCFIDSCPFSHKVAPEKMPTCQYFLRGYCGREDCPYRHVNVDKNAKPCPDFIKGYCVRGLKCPLKHTLLCPEFEVKGSCGLGNKCKLHHPKKRKCQSQLTTNRQKRRAIPMNVEDEDDINAPFGERHFPSYIALPSPCVSLSFDTSAEISGYAEVSGGAEVSDDDYEDMSSLVT